MSPKFQVYKDSAKRTRFRIRANNNQIVAVGEAYERYASCIKGIESVKRNCNAEIEDLTVEDGPKLPNPKYQIFKDNVGKLRFHLKAANGEIIAKSEGYESREGCLNGIDVIRHCADAEVDDPYAKKSVPAGVLKEKIEKPATAKSTPPKTVLEEKLPEVKVDTPSTPVLPAEKVPKLQLPSEKPEVMLPEIDTKTPKLKAPEIHAAEVKTPEVKIPEVKTPEIEIPELNASEIKAPDLEVPKVKAPEIEIPETAIPMPEVKPVPLTAVKETAFQELGSGETKLELDLPPDNVAKGDKIALKGRLFWTNNGRGVPGAKIRIYERDRSILGKDYLAYGLTGEDGSFSLDWKARPLSWRKTTGDIYAEFNGNERANPSKSNPCTINIRT